MSVVPPEINFDNTKVAFQSLSNAELHKASLLFRSFGSNFLVETGPKLISIAMKLRLPITPVIKNTIFKHFCGGETIEETYSQTIQDLSSKGVGSILDYSVEGLETEEGFDHTCEELLRTINFASHRQKEIPFAVFKPTALARIKLLTKVDSEKSLTPLEVKEFTAAKARIRRICKAAADANLRVMIDAEESWIQNAIDEIAMEMMQEFNQQKAIIYNTLQLYRVDRLDYLKQSYLHARACNIHLGVKLVRGAYMEKERERAKNLGYKSPIHPTKQATDEAYDAAQAFCVENLEGLAFCSGSHNESSMYKLTKLMEKSGIDPSDRRIEFSQLLGMGNNLSFNLAHHGYNVSKYVPYGPVKAVMPYLFRRAEENTSIQGQAGRELQLIQKELARRSSEPS